MSGTKAGAAKRHQTQPASEIAPQEPAESRPDHKVYVVAPKRALRHGDKMLQAGEVVPDAHLWLRLESWINTGRIVEQA